MFLLTWDDWGGFDDRWNSHVSIGKTVLDLPGLPPLGVPRLDDAPSLADLISPTASPPPVSASTPMGPVPLRNGTPLPPPNDQPVT